MSALPPGHLDDVIGAAAAVLTTLAFVPQAWLTLRTRDVSGISLTMYAILTLGVALWLVYGLMLQAWPVIIANAITLALAGTILTMKLWFSRGRRTAAAR
jgi:MtN3 and saliva related transmembrane protein